MADHESMGVVEPLPTPNVESISRESPPPMPTVESLSMILKDYLEIRGVLWNAGFVPRSDGHWDFRDQSTTLGFKMSTAVKYLRGRS